MKRQKSEFSSSSNEELDLKHQGSLGGEYVKHHGVNVTGNITGMVEDANPAADQPDASVSSPSHARAKQASPEPAHREQPKQAQTSKKHHYK